MADPAVHHLFFLPHPATARGAALAVRPTVSTAARTLCPATARRLSGPPALVRATIGFLRSAGSFGAFFVVHRTIS